jgi:hypothetical protein
MTLNNEVNFWKRFSRAVHEDEDRQHRLEMTRVQPKPPKLQKPREASEDFPRS